MFHKSMRNKKGQSVWNSRPWGKGSLHPGIPSSKYLADDEEVSGQSMSGRIFLIGDKPRAFKRIREFIDCWPAAQVTEIIGEGPELLERCRNIIDGPEGLERAKADGKKLGRPKGSLDTRQRSKRGYLLRYA